jgi:hypothetical protein
MNSTPEKCGALSDAATTWRKASNYVHFSTGSRRKVEEMFAQSNSPLDMSAEVEHDMTRLQEEHRGTSR